MFHFTKRVCFYCNREISDIEESIYWSGSTSEISLHPHCTADLAIRLLRDVHELECRQKKHLVMRTEQTKK